MISHWLYVRTCVTTTHFLKIFNTICHKTVLKHLVIKICKKKKEIVKQDYEHISSANCLQNYIHDFILSLDTYNFTGKRHKEELQQWNLKLLIILVTSYSCFFFPKTVADAYRANWCFSVYFVTPILWYQLSINW